MFDDSLVDVTVRDSVAIVRLNRPEKLNAVSLSLLEEFRDSLRDLDDESIGGLVVSGSGKATCAGMDKDIVSDEAYDEKYGERISRLNDEVFEFLTSRSYPTAMAGHGALVGIGFAFSLRCDFLVLGEETTFSLPEIKYGISTVNSIPYLERMVGTRAAKEIVYTGEPIPPERALALGLASRVVPESDVEDAAVDLIGNIAEYDSDVVAKLKAASQPNEVTRPSSSIESP